MLEGQKVTTEFFSDAGYVSDPMSPMHFHSRRNSGSFEDSSWHVWRTPKENFPTEWQQWFYPWQAHFQLQCSALWGLFTLPCLFRFHLAPFSRVGFELHRAWSAGEQTWTVHEELFFAWHTKSLSCLGMGLICADVWFGSDSYVLLD